MVLGHELAYFSKQMSPREYILSQYDSSPSLTACKIVVIVIDSSFVEQVEEPGIYLSKY
jgi:hypothetical protein